MGAVVKGLTDVGIVAWCERCGWSTEMLGQDENVNAEVEAWKRDHERTCTDV